jgi:cobalamin biosynthesis Mg chelatase CobN
MNRLIIIVLILFLYSCGTTKKITQSDSNSKVNIESAFLDTSKRIASWEVMLNSVMTVIDLRKIRITTFYQERDSSGKQSVKEVIEIDHNVAVTDSKSAQQSIIEKENKAVSQASTLTRETETKVTTSIERESSPVKLKFLIWIGVILAFLLICRIFFRKILKKILGG